MLEGWEKKKWIEKYTTQKKTENETRKAKKNVDGRSERDKRRKMGGRKENAQKQRNVDTIMQERPMKLYISQPYTSW